ncbi:MAG: C39 family peptidase [Pirellulales bacterium]
MALSWRRVAGATGVLGLVTLAMLAASADLSRNAAGQAAAAPKYATAVIQGVPHVRQLPDFCGEACAEMYLAKLGQRIDQRAVFDASGLDPALGRGCYTRELDAALKKLGFDTGDVFTTIDARRADAELERLWSALHKDLAVGTPSIICTRYDNRPNTTEHFRLILGYDAKTDEVFYHEPAEDGGRYRRMKRTAMLDLWPLKYGEREWTVIRMRLAAEKIKPPAATKAKFTPADYAQHILALMKKLPSEDFHVVIEPPFVVVGDEDVATLRRRARDTIRWSVEKLKKDYFTADPAHILDIWLFANKDSYETHATQLFGGKPTTPYGYYSAQHKALVMNISTGGGTLVHEIVHPLMATNFPACPSWFNEGLASLYEQCGERDGHIRGEVNWRLAGLQRTIKDERLPTFETLCGTTTQEFYDGEHAASNYGQARYLCYYLQERSQLVDFYHAFRKNAAADPTGYETLKKTLGERDMAAFQQRWQKYVGELKYR